MKRMIPIGLLMLFSVSMVFGVTYRKVNMNGTSNTVTYRKGILMTDTIAAGKLYTNDVVTSDTVDLYALQSPFDLLDVAIKFTFDSGHVQGNGTAYEDTTALKLILSLWTVMEDESPARLVCARADTISGFPDSTLWNAIPVDSLYRKIYFTARIIDSLDLTGAGAAGNDTNQFTFNTAIMLK